MPPTSPKARGLLSRPIQQWSPRENDSDVSPSGASHPSCVDKEAVQERTLVEENTSEATSLNSGAYLPFSPSSGFPRLLEANIFKHDLPPELESQVLEKFQLLPLSAHSPLASPGHTTLPFTDLDKLTEYLLNWCITREVSPVIAASSFHHQGQTASITALLTSPALVSVLQNHDIDPTTITTFQTFLLATTLQHTGWHDHRPAPQRLSPADLHLASHAAGSLMLQHHLPKLLASGTLDSKASLSAPSTKATLQAKIVIVIATILGVMYTPFPNNTLVATSWLQNIEQLSPPPASQNPVSSISSSSKSSSSSFASPNSVSGCTGTLITPSQPFQHSPTQWLAAKERLRLVLARDFVGLAKPLGLVPDDKTETAIIDGLMMRRRAWEARDQQWVWGNVLVPSPTATASITPFSHPLPQNGGWEGGFREDNEKGSYLDGPAGTFHPSPQAVMVGQSEIMSPHFPRPDRSDGRKRRSMILVGPWEDRQMYARMRVVAESGPPSMMV